MTEANHTEPNRSIFTTPDSKERDNHTQLISLMRQLYFGPPTLIEETLIRIVEHSANCQQDVYKAWEDYQIANEANRQFFVYNESRVLLIGFAVQRIGNEKLQLLIQQTIKFLKASPSQFVDHWHVFIQPLFSAILMCTKSSELFSATELAWSKEQQNPSRMYQAVRMAATFQGVDSACQSLSEAIEDQGEYKGAAVEIPILILAKSQSPQARIKAVQFVNDHSSEFIYLRDHLLVNLLVHEPNQTQALIFELATKYLTSLLVAPSSTFDVSHKIYPAESSSDDDQSSDLEISVESLKHNEWEDSTSISEEIFSGVALSLSLSGRETAKKLLLALVQSLHSPSNLFVAASLLPASVLETITDWEIMRELMLYSLTHVHNGQNHSLARMATYGLIVSGVMPGDQKWLELESTAKIRSLEAQWSQIAPFYAFMISAYNSETNIPTDFLADNLDTILQFRPSQVRSNALEYWLESTSIDSQSKQIALLKIVEVACSAVTRWNQHATLALNFLSLTVFPKHLQPQIREALFEAAKTAHTRKQKLEAYSTVVRYAFNSGDHGAIAIMLHQLNSNMDSGEGADSIYFLLIPLLESKARFAQRTLKQLFIRDVNNGPISRRILKSYFENGTYDPRIAQLGSEQAVMSAVRSLLNLGYEPVFCLVKDVLDGQNPQLRVLQYQNLKPSLQLWQILKTTEYTQLEFAISSHDPHYSNTLSWENYQRIIQETLKTDDNDNINVRDKLLQQWRRETRLKQTNIAAFQHLFYEGIGSREVSPLALARSASESSSAQAEYIQLQINELRNLVLPIVLIESLIGRIAGLIKRIDRNSKDTAQALSSQLISLVANIDLSIASGANAFANFNQIYEQLFSFYTELLRDQQLILPNIPLSTAEEMIQVDRTAVATALQPLSPREQAQMLFTKLGKALTRLNIVIRMDNMQRVATDVGLRLSKLSQNIPQAELQMKNDHSYRVEFVTKREVKKFIRVGDARESCIASNGDNSWSISGYIADDATQAVIVVDQTTNVAVGHCMIHLAEIDENGKTIVRPIINGRYLADAVPSEVGDAIIQYWSDWAQQAGLGPPLLAKDPYGNHQPPAEWEIKPHLIKIMQGAKYVSSSGCPSNLYYDFEAPLEEFAQVELYQLTTS